MVKYLFDRYKIQEMSDKAINSFLPALKLVPDLFFYKKLLKNFTMLCFLITI